MQTNKIEFQKWRDRVLQLRWRHTQKEDLEFCALVEQVAGINDIEIVRTLLETFTAWSEVGVQQTVVRVLGSFDILLYYQAYLEALPRLVADDAWWDMELGSYPERDPTGVELRGISKIVNSMPDENIDQFLRVLMDSEFDFDHNWAESLKNMIKYNR